MWFGPLSLLSQYAQYMPLFDRAHEFIAALPKENLVPGSMLEIEGKRLYASVGGFTTQPRTERRFEAHEIYADIHYLVAGEECIDVAPAKGLAVLEAYDTEKDIVFLEEANPYSSLVLRPGDAAILFPEEAHKPGCLITEPTEVIKLVVKVRLRP
ncbi:YhcH/YjgK/YiaL family protein [Desulfovibrio sp. OttesenSCG-928-G15]|nr:YhcH/YjgK/YiaL family protein [Desulfovibrio sp. OttesenSCG-928-G15]